MATINQLYALSEALGLKLKARSWSLALAESCTGGLVAGAITQIPGSSQWFDCGVVSYSNAAKIRLLGVPEQVLVQFGAVSSQTAISMAEGVRDLNAVQIALSITGIAGPDGGTAEKPIGLVYFALSSLEYPTEVKELHLTGSRAEIREQSIRYALEWLNSFLDAH